MSAEGPHYPYTTWSNHGLGSYFKQFSFLYFPIEKIPKCWILIFLSLPQLKIDPHLELWNRVEVLFFFVEVSKSNSNERKISSSPLTSIKQPNRLCTKELFCWNIPGTPKIACCFLLFPKPVDGFLLFQNFIVIFTNSYLAYYFIIFLIIYYLVI